MCKPTKQFIKAVINAISTTGGKDHALKQRELYQSQLIKSGTIPTYKVDIEKLFVRNKSLTVRTSEGWFTVYGIREGKLLTYNDNNSIKLIHSKRVIEYKVRK